MKGQRLQVALAAVVILLVTMVWSGCGPKDQPTDLLDQPVESPTASSTSGQSGDDWPPPPAVPGGTSSDSGDEEASASMPPPAALPPDLVDIYFDFDEYRLSADARQTLAQNARLLGDAEMMTVVIEGHCDERGTIEYNLALGEKRAGAVKEYLVRYGIDTTRLRTVSFGEERPLDSAATEDAWAKNRRAHLRGR